MTLVWNGSAWVPSGATTEFSYDHRNRLVKVAESFTPGGTPSKWTEYAYDAFNRRVTKSVNTNPTTSAIDRYEYYVWDGDDVVLDFVDADGGSSPSASLDRRYLWGNAVGQILAQESAAGTVRWMLADHQGSVRDTVDNAGALAGDHIVFDSFGNLSGTLTTRFAYTGQEYDADAGMYCYNARWYDPRSGRFVTKDPIGFRANDTNVYRYVGNNAANGTDPSGLIDLDYFSWVLVRLREEKRADKLDEEFRKVNELNAAQSSDPFADVDHYRTAARQGSEKAARRINTAAEGCMQFEQAVMGGMGVAGGGGGFADDAIGGVLCGADDDVARGADDLMEGAGRIGKSGGRSFGDRLTNIFNDPNDWELVSVHAEKATRKGYPKRLS